VIEVMGRHLPQATTTGRYTVEAGFLLSYSTTQDDIWRLSAEFADRILRGARPAEMPIEQPSRYELFVNQKTAKAIGLTIPQPLLLRADEVLA
jgi:putative ABC transport system substrate-binding protein